MNTSIQFLPTSRREQVWAIVEIIKQEVSPEMIILFGSYAKGKIVQHPSISGQGHMTSYASDVDFLVVTRDDAKNPGDYEWAVYERTKDHQAPVNLQIHDIAYINKALEIGQYFFSDVIKEGILLFDTGNLTFTQPRTLTDVEKKLIAQKEYDFWLKKGTECLFDTKQIFNRKNHNKAAFELHQAAENFYYATLLVCTNYKPKTHNLLNLRNLCSDYSEDLLALFPIETSRAERKLLSLLKRAYIEARYHSDYEISEKELVTLIERIEQMQTIVEKICTQKISSFVA